MRGKTQTSDDDITEVAWWEPAEEAGISSAATHTSEVCLLVCWLAGRLTSQQQVSVSQGRISSDKFTCCHTDTKVADQTRSLAKSNYTDIDPARSSSAL